MIQMDNNQNAAMTLSVCIICFNEEVNIRRCLESVSWVDEIIVVDSMSNDRTAEIAAEFTDKIYEREWTGYVEQKNFALSKAKGHWILSLDADEEVSESLRNEITAEISKKDVKEGYRIPRRSFYQGRWINHSGFYPDRQLRLFKSDEAHWIGGRVHERVEVAGMVGDLKNHTMEVSPGCCRRQTIILGYWRKICLTEESDTIFICFSSVLCSSLSRYIS